MLKVGKSTKLLWSNNHFDFGNRDGRPKLISDLLYVFHGIYNSVWYCQYVAKWNYENSILKFFVFAQKWIFLQSKILNALENKNILFRNISKWSDENTVSKLVSTMHFGTSKRIKNELQKAMQICSNANDLKWYPPIITVKMNLSKYHVGHFIIFHYCIFTVLLVLQKMDIYILFCLFLTIWLCNYHMKKRHNC